MEYLKYNQHTFVSLTKEQRKAIGLLSIGTFLEYFDLLLYVHMGVLLNELFFPVTDPHMKKIHTATAFCTTFIFRPIGSLVIGWIGDTIGRKATVVVTTLMMAISCLVMANLPSYAQIGITATWVVTLCRIFQGMSSMEEIVGAELYLTESIGLPIRYSVVTSMTIFSALGGTAALGVATLATKYGLSWRIAFWIGALIALVGSMARRALRETPEFADAKRRLKNDLALALDKGVVNRKVLEDNVIWRTKVDKKTALAYFLIQCARPVCFYFIYVFCPSILETRFQYDAVSIIENNFLLSIVDLSGIILLTYLSSIVYPLHILKVKFLVFIITLFSIPYLLAHATSAMHIFLIQSFVALFSVDTSPASAIFYKHFPIFKRFTYAGFMYALSRAVMYLCNAYGLVYLVERYNVWGILCIMLPVTLGFGYALLHFSRLEQATKDR